jgi:glucokinase
MLLLAGDIGGTKTALCLYESVAGGGFRRVRSALVPSAEHPSLLAVLQQVLGEPLPRLDAAGFGVAGPVVGGECATTNLPWRLSAAELSTRLGAPVALMNDFEATAHGVRELSPSMLHVLQEGRCDPTGPFAVIGAGTGLGEAIGVPTRDGLRVLAGEGGHADFAPRSDREVRLLQFLRARHGGDSARVSIERAVSGLGLPSLYEFVVQEGRAAADPVTLARLALEAPAAVIGERGLSGDDPAASEALTLFVSLYGAEAGNLALRVLPTGGLYIAGGIAPKLLPRFCDGTFMTSFLAKGRMSKILAEVRVCVVLEPEVGLLGARACAALLCDSR